ncbi:PREDICTED: uncharacterized protein LOC105513691 [Colobus angolensis palliatus]|uniref:uncharacterized protein LOC105513691 n=1 Tax=Colobus angolensis palliatus TaxID=336983 RepID=UPI0005F4417C|nr:PREDICTED: uncharacterized protein LOC105513691 [Colobus angolensis palliatus]
MHHRFLFSRNRLQRFVAFQTAAGTGQRHRLRPELLATASRLAVHPRLRWPAPQPESFPFRAGGAVPPYIWGKGAAALPVPRAQPPPRGWVKRRGRGGRRAWGTPSSALRPRWRSGCLFKRSGGAGAGGRRARFHGIGAAGAAGRLGSLGFSRSRRSRGMQLSGHRASGARPGAPPALPAASDACWGQAAAVPAADRRTAPASRALHQLLSDEPNFCAGFGLAERERRAARSPGGGQGGSASPRCLRDCASASGRLRAGRQEAPYSSGWACQVFVKNSK